VISGFTRQETIALTGISPNKLSYLDRTGLVVPEKIGNSKHPKVVYRWEKVLEIKMIERLREKLSLQEIRKVLDFLRDINYKSSFFAHHLVFVNSQLYFIEDAKDFGLKVLEASGTNKGQVVIREVGMIGNIITELWQEAEKHQVLDFEKRAGAKPQDLDNEFQLAFNGG
jgi:DNA-binding transcriptional MerR regulator